MNASTAVRRDSPVPAEENDSRVQHRTERAYLLLPALCTLLIGLATLAVTFWCVRDGSAHPHQPVSSAALLIGLFYLLVLVAVIRFLCFAGVLLSPQRKDAAPKLLPGVSLLRVLPGRLKSPSVTWCRRLGWLALAEAVALLALWAGCIAKLWQSS